jgi:GGDEF domain-containing protein
VDNQGVEIPEVVVWSAMLGGLLTLVAAAMADAVVNRSVNSWRNLLFVLITGLSCVIITGLPEVLFPALPDPLVMLLKVSMGPLSAAIALSFLGIWLGGTQEDVIVHRITTWGSVTLLFSAFALALLAAQATGQQYRPLLLTAAAINLVAALLGVGVSVRAALLGDPLARWMALACACLTVMTIGLYLKGLHIQGFGLGTWIVTAVCTLGYFLIATVLIVMRIRHGRQLARLTRLQFGADPATGLPTGSILLSKVEHAFWRTARLHGECTVVCLHLRNLYELGESAGHGVDHQILAVMAARIRRVAGFRCIVGLYHPRCFAVVISADKYRKNVNTTVLQLRKLISDPLSVVGLDQERHEFTPQLGVGVITVDPASADPLDAINTAERRALAPESELQEVPEDVIDTAW